MSVPRATALLWTEHSVYEVDESTRMIRRAGGRHAPSPRVGEGWKPFLVLQAEVGRPALIVWSVQENGHAPSTLISPVVAVERLEEARGSG